MVLALGWAEGIEQGADAAPRCLMGSLGGFAHEVFELGEHLLDRVQIWRVWRPL